MRTTLDSDTYHRPEMWQATYQLLEQTIVEAQLRAWIQPLEWVGQKEDGNQLVVELRAPNDFSAEWIRDHYSDAIEQALTQVSGRPCKLEIFAKETTKISSSERDETESRRGIRHQSFMDSDPFFEGGRKSSYESGSYRYSDQDSSQNQVRISPTPTIDPRADHRFSELAGSQGVVLKTGLMRNEIGIDSRFTFDNFVVGASNQFAHASALAASERPGEQYNPLFFYGAPGLGKTHLLHGIGNYVIAKNPSAKVAYLSAENFVNELIESLQRQKMSQFRNKFRFSYDVLLIDDIQFIAGKKQTEEEFFHTFNALYAAKRQIVMTSDRPPKEIENLEERIRTRFEWGLVADIQPPEIETRIAILKGKAERDDIYLPDDVSTFLATHIKTNVRELEGILIRLQAQASLTGAEISLEMAKSQLRLASPEQSSQLTVENIQTVVAKHFKLKISDLKSSSRNKTVTVPRQISMFLARKYTGMGYKEIGSYFGGKDHTTVLHACNKIEREVESEIMTREAVETIQNLL